MQIETILMWTVNVHKIHIKEWALVKDKFLSMIFEKLDIFILPKR